MRRRLVTLVMRGAAPRKAFACISFTTNICYNCVMKGIYYYANAI